MGLRFDEPEPVLCHWCGRPLVPLGTDFMGQVHWVINEPCSCEGAKAERDRIEREKRREEEREVARRIAAAGVSRRFVNARTSIPEIGDFLAGFDPRGGNGLYISGNVGSGKTHAASALARALMYNDASVVMTTTLDMLDSIQATYGKSASQSGGVRHFTGCDLLILDDIGKENGNGWALTTLFQVVNTRYEEMRPIVVTSQYPLASLARRLGRSGERESAEAIASRLFEMCAVVALPNVDRRKLKRK